MSETIETWRNVTAGLRGIVRYDRFGNVTHEIVDSGKTVILTRDERLLNQERAANVELDVFQNGALVPVKLVDPEDIAEFATNPNMMTEDELKGLFKLTLPRLKARLQDITNIYALDRLLALTETDDVAVTIKQQSAIRDRLKEVNPSAAIEVEQVSGPKDPIRASKFSSLG